jgi:transposase
MLRNGEITHTKRCGPMKRHDPAIGNVHVFVGLDVHKDSISACVYDREREEVLLEQKLRNDPAAVRKLVARIRDSFGEPRFCYEASSCGFVLFRQMKELSAPCEVIAPSSIPRRSGDRIKNDSVDARKLATLFAAGLLAGVEVPDEEIESTRALLRCRAALVDELGRAKKRTTQFLQTRGFVYREGTNWSQKFREWLARIELSTVDQVVVTTQVDLIHYLEGQIASLETVIEGESEKPRYQEPVRLLKAFRGIATLTALTLASEVGDIRRFDHPRRLMAYLGLVPSEHSSGNQTHRGSITKAGNTHARRAIVSAAWKYTVRPTRSHRLAEHQRSVDPHVVAISWKAQQRLYKRFQALVIRRPRSVAATAIARELTGFLWEAMNTLNFRPTATA